MSPGKTPKAIEGLKRYLEAGYDSIKRILNQVNKTSMG